MSATNAVSLTPAHMVQFLHRHAWLWAAPAVAGVVLAAFVALVTPRKWEATQGFLIRSEAAGFAEQRLGKFTDLSEMKAVQETVLEIARSQSVLTAALEQVGPRSSWIASANYPTPEAIVSLRKNMEISPPGGAEFGMTEVFYLTVFDKDPQRAEQLAAAVAEQLESRLAAVRDERASSLISELQNSVEAARAARDVEAAKLAEFESQVGADLAELRSLDSPIGGQGELAQTTVAIEAALRENAAARRQNEQLLALLNASLDSPEQLLATPSSLLASQPALDRLKAGLVNAQMNAASLAGTRSDSHPLVIAARSRADQLRTEFHKELPTAVAGIKLELTLNKQRSAALRAELADARGRLASLAGKRSSYSNLVATVENHNRLVETAEDQLADARAHQAGAQSSSVLSRIDQVEAGLYPVGPGRTTIALAGGVAGLVLGLGLLFSFHSPAELLPQPASQPAVPSFAETAAGPFGTPEYDLTGVWTPAAAHRQAVGAGYSGHNGFGG